MHQLFDKPNFPVTLYNTTYPLFLALFYTKAMFLCSGSVEKRFWSATFYLATGMVTVMVLLPSLQVLLENRPVLWLAAFILSSKYRVSIIVECC